MLNQRGKWFTCNDTFQDYSSAQTVTVVYTPASGKSVRILGYAISTNAANTITVLIGNTTVMKFYFSTNGGANLDASSVPVAVGAADEVIKVTSTATTGHSIAFSGYEE